ncbi:MAG: undecaprenyldiphospho-muramoylpentapeptide beta-N-acetylglucosaminyltransferase [Alphaproteobacteria bacterium]|nr:undecaprenyldiphospho-muramoylpentapeptide beta-N-acetylglucosaminyltransferase [Alphaproteobacteria bacterium]
MTRLRPVALAAGGTGGHVFPAEALAEELERRGRRVICLTDQRGARFGERFSAPEAYRLRAVSDSGRGPLGRMAAYFEIGVSVLQARRVLARSRAAAVIGFGGYPAIPAVLAGGLLGLPTALHEQNAVLGRSNRFLAGRVQAIGLGFPHTARLPASLQAKVVVTGNPLGSRVTALTNRGYVAPGQGEPFNFLVVGGSQGARMLSEAVPAALALLLPAQRRRLALTLQCRPEDREATAASLARHEIRAELASFFSDLPERLADSHLVLARSGAGTVAELAAIGRPALLAPYPFAADDHQSANAQAMVAAGGAWLVQDADLEPRALATRLAELMAEPQRLAASAERARAFGRPRATAVLADLLEGLLAQADCPVVETRRAA